MRRWVAGEVTGCRAGTPVAVLAGCMSSAVPSVQSPFCCRPIGVTLSIQACMSWMTSMCEQNGEGCSSHTSWDTTNIPRGRCPKRS